MILGNSSDDEVSNTDQLRAAQTKNEIKKNCESRGDWLLSCRAIFISGAAAKAFLL